MSDLYKLEWIHSLKTIQEGISRNLNRDTFLDTMVVCSDGVATHNKLVLGLVFPELCHVPVFDNPQEQTLILPEHSVAEVQSLVSEMFPGSDMATDVKDDEVEPTITTDNFEHFLDSEPDASPKTFGMRRGRGRPPLNTARMPPRFTCDFCNKGFFYRSMLTAHEKLHTGGSRETCELCGAEYSTRQNLKNHIIKQHGEHSFTPRKRGRPPLDPERRSAPHPASASTSGNPLRPGYRGRGRPPLMTKHRGLTHFDSYNAHMAAAGDTLPASAVTNSYAETNLSAESFMEQKMENDSDGDEERSLEAVRASSTMINSLPTSSIAEEEPEDIKPDITSHPISCNTQSNSQSSEPNNTNTSYNESATTNSYHNNFGVPAHQQHQQQQPQYNNSFVIDANNQFYSELQQQVMQQHQQQSTSQQSFYGAESRMTTNNFSSEDSRPGPEGEYQV